MALGMSLLSAVMLVLSIIIINSLIAAGLIRFILKKRIFWKAFTASVIIWLVLVTLLVVYLRMTIGEFL